MLNQSRVHDLLGMELGAFGSVDVNGTASGIAGSRVFRESGSVVGKMKEDCFLTIPSSRCGHRLWTPLAPDENGTPQPQAGCNGTKVAALPCTPLVH
jgi:hypothetical protein